MNLLNKLLVSRTSSLPSEIVQNALKECNLQSISAVFKLNPKGELPKESIKFLNTILPEFDVKQFHFYKLFNEAYDNDEFPKKAAEIAHNQPYKIFSEMKDGILNKIHILSSTPLHSNFPLYLDRQDIYYGKAKMLIQKISPNTIVTDYLCLLLNQNDEGKYLTTIDVSEESNESAFSIRKLLSKDLKDNVLFRLFKPLPSLPNKKC